MLCVLLMMFVFFFKQKTAYEMRISDWSSDVCSSDLDALAAAQLRAPLYEDKVVDFLFDKAEISEREVTREEIEAAIEADDDGHVQIGRAACRERVCQYV